MKVIREKVFQVTRSKNGIDSYERNKKHKKNRKKNDLPLVELYSPMYRLVKQRTTTAERKTRVKRVKYF